MTTGAVPYASHFKQRDREQLMGEYVERIAPASMKRDREGSPYYVFEDISAVLKKEGTSAADRQTLEAIMSAYDWRPPFLRHDHDMQHYLTPVAHQLFVGGIGTGAPVHWHGWVQ